MRHTHLVIPGKTRNLMRTKHIRPFGGGVERPPAAPVITGVPAIDDTTPTVGQTLTAIPAFVSGNPQPVRTWQWKLDNVNISGAVSINYTVALGDEGGVLSVVQTETNSEGSDTAESAQTSAVVHAPPVAGGALEDQTYTQNTGLQLYDASVDFVGEDMTFSVNTVTGVSINPSTGVVTTDTDVTNVQSGTSIVVTATNSGGSDNSGYSLTIEEPLTAPVNITPPSIPATGAVGVELTRTEGVWSGNPAPSLSGQWRKGTTNIAGETGPSYTPDEARNDYNYLETATNSEGSANQASNNSDVSPAPSAPVITGVPTIDNKTPSENDTLTVSFAPASGTPTPVNTAEWFAGAISRGTGTQYVVTAADVGEVITVVQTATNSEGSDNATSDPTAPVTGAQDTIDNGDGTIVIINNQGLNYTVDADENDFDGTYSATDAQLADGPVIHVTPDLDDDGTPQVGETLTVRHALVAYDAANGAISRSYVSSGTNPVDDTTDPERPTVLVDKADMGSSIIVTETITQGVLAPVNLDTNAVVIDPAETIDSLETSVDGLTITVDYGNPLSGSVATGDYTVTQSGWAGAISAANIVGNTIVLTLDTALVAVTAITLDYTNTGDSLLDSNGNPILDFTGEPVTNNVPAAGASAIFYDNTYVTASQAVFSGVYDLSGLDAGDRVLIAVGTGGGAPTSVTVAGVDVGVSIADTESRPTGAKTWFYEYTMPATGSAATTIEVTRASGSNNNVISVVGVKNATRDSLAADWHGSPDTTLDWNVTLAATGLVIGIAQGRDSFTTVMTWTNATEQSNTVAPNNERGVSLAEATAVPAGPYTVQTTVPAGPPGNDEMAVGVFAYS